MCTGGERSSSAATGGRCRAGEELGWDVRFLVRYIGLAEKPRPFALQWIPAAISC